MEGFNHHHLITVVLVTLLCLSNCTRQARWPPMPSSSSSNTLYPSYNSHHPPHKEGHYVHPKHQRVHASSLQSMSFSAPEASLQTVAGGSAISSDDLKRINDIATKNTVAAMLDFIKLVQSKKSCNDSVSLSRFNYTFPKSSYERFGAQTRAAIRTANVLNNLFRTFDASPNTLYNDAFYYSLVRAVVENDPLIYGSSIAFEGKTYSNKKSGFCPYVYRTKQSSNQDSNTNSDFIAVDLAEVSKGDYATINSSGYEWFWRQRVRNFSSLLYDKNIMCTRLKQTDDPKKLANHSVVISTNAQGLWTAPYFDCKRGQNWQMTYSVPFFGCDIYGNLQFKGVVAVDINLEKTDMQQCDNTPSLFSNTHRCHQLTTKCKNVPGQGFHRGNYRCNCRPEYYNTLQKNSPLNFDGLQMEEDYIHMLLQNDNMSHFDAMYSCRPCYPGCVNCTDDGPCRVDYDVMMRGVPLALQSFCMTITVVLAMVIIHLRSKKVMKASMWLMLLIILAGALLLYSTVVIQYFEPSVATCVLIPWFREIGFIIVYGALILKVYRILAEFQSRKAHRVHVRDKDLLKYLLTITIIVVCYLAAWTTVNLDHVKQGRPVIETGNTTDNLSFETCELQWWHYYVEVAEFLFMCLGIYLCYCIRSAPQEYGEPRYVSWAIYNETIWSAMLNLTRHFLWLSVHPDYIFLLYFIRCQLTVSITLILVIGPKLWYVHRPPEDEHFRNRAYSSSDVHDTILPESMKLQVGVSSNGDVDVADINLADMTSEDIRAELKRLYTQLQIYKTKTMRKDNPHISKRRGGRKQTHRRFSLQAFHYKHRHHHSSASHSDMDHEHTELSKTPEESTNSAEAVAIQMDGGSRVEEDSTSTTRAPTVTFKPGHKSFC